MLPFTFDHDIAQLVRSRISTRTYSSEPIDAALRAELDRACEAASYGLMAEPASFRLVDKGPAARDQKLAVSDYGFIVNPRYFFIGKIVRSARCFESYGYLLEPLVLKATDLGLDTCWVGYFHQDYFSGDFSLSDDEVFPAIATVGHGAEKRTLKERLVRLAVGAAKRKPWQALFFQGGFGTPLSAADCGAYAEALEMVRLAPSAGNTQCWRVVRDERGSRFHFYLAKIRKAYHQRHLHEIDIGIALSHFELAATENGLSGRWEVVGGAPAVPDGSDIEYRLSWVE